MFICPCHDWNRIFSKIPFLSLNLIWSRKIGLQHHLNPGFLCSEEKRETVKIPKITLVFLKIQFKRLNSFKDYFNIFCNLEEMLMWIVPCNAHDQIKLLAQKRNICLQENYWISSSALPQNSVCHLLQYKRDGRDKVWTNTSIESAQTYQS